MMNLLTPPIFDDEDKTLVAHHLFIILCTFMAVGWLALLIAIIIPETIYRWLLVVGVIESAGLILLALNKQGHTRLVSQWLIFVIWAAATGMAVTGGGTSSNAMAIYFIVVLVAGLVLSGKAGIITAVLCSLTGLFLAYLEYSGALPVNQVPHTPLTQWIANSIYMAIIISLQSLVSRTIRRALQQSRQELKERQRADTALRESKELYTKLIATMPDIMVKMNLKGEILFINDVGLSLGGYRSTELIGQNMFSMIAPEDHDEAARNTVLMFERKLGPKEYHLIMKDGGKRLFEVNGDVLRNEDGSPYGLVQICRDITERKQVEEALTKSEERFRKAFFTSPDSVNINRLEDGMYVSINPGFTKITGYTEEDIIGMTSLECNIWANIEERERLVEGLRKDGEVTNLEACFRMKSGDIRYGLMSASVIDLDGVPHILNITRDITERKRAEEELFRTLKSLRNAVGTTIRVMASAVEIKDPYTAGHQIRSADLARAIATEMGFIPDRIDAVRMASSIHDLGKLSIPAEILSKPTKLTPIEFSLIKEHARSGYEILKDIESPWPLAQIVYQHHERMDGSGYPRNLKGDEILMEARILAVSDVVESMASHRPYRPALGLDAALEEIEKNRGTLYDKTVADACLSLFREKGFKLEEN
jgi:PAS domain S-box-containing protein